jgi:hypothetical protein
MENPFAFKEVIAAIGKLITVKTMLKWKSLLVILSLTQWCLDS